MNEITTSTIIGLVVIFGLVFGLLLIAYEDGVPFGLYKRIRCKLGKHSFRSGFRRHVQKYYCQSCKSPRKHPELRAIEGGKKELDIFHKI